MIRLSAAKELDFLRSLRFNDVPRVGIKSHAWTQPRPVRGSLQPAPCTTNLQRPRRISSGYYYPFNKALDDDLDRLFAEYQKSFYPGPERIDDELSQEFQKNGRDTEFFPTEEKICNKSRVINAKKGKNSGTKRECAFCKNNQRPEWVYKGHTLKDADGKTTCPFLRSYVCPKCGASGDNSHTLRYCPNKEIVGAGPIFQKNF